MKHEKFGSPKPPSFKVFLTDEENARLEAYLARRGAKKGPFAKALVLEALSQDEGIRAGRSQIDAAALAAPRLEVLP